MDCRCVSAMAEDAISYTVEGQKQDSPSLSSVDRVQTVMAVRECKSGEYEAAGEMGLGYGPSAIAAIRDALRLNGYDLRAAAKAAGQVKPWTRDVY